jgi:quercetin dioxygenase-like cupin family protein
MPRLLLKCAAILAAAQLMVFATGAVLAQGEAQKKPAAPPPPPPKPAAGHVMLDAATLKWGPAPPGLPAGAQVAVLDGDPSKPGTFAIRVTLPDGYAVQPHWHPTAENLVILTGTLMVGIGDKFDEASMHALAAGGYSKMPAKTRHYVRAKGETTFQLYGVGPFAINYVNPKDDPRKKTN